MKSFIKWLFWFWFPAPEVGDKFRHESALDDPWADTELDYKIIDRKGNWYRVERDHGQRTMHRRTIMSFYFKVSTDSVKNPYPCDWSSQSQSEPVRQR